MKKLCLISLIIVQSCIALAQNCCVNDSVNKLVFINPDLPPYYLHGGDKGLLSDLYTAIIETAPVTQDSVKGRFFTMRPDFLILLVNIAKENAVSCLLVDCIFALLPWRDSNPRRRNQNPTCYHYTTRQSVVFVCHFLSWSSGCFRLTCAKL